MVNSVYDKLLGNILKRKFIGYRAGIYIIRCLVNAKIYIGSTGNFDKRFECHKLALNHKKHSNYKLQLDFNLYGIDNFVFERHMEYMAGYNRSHLYKLEQIEIDKLKPHYNIQLKVYDPANKITRRQLKKIKKQNKNKLKKNIPKQVKSKQPRKIKISEHDKRRQNLSKKGAYLKNLNVVNDKVNSAWRERLKNV